MIHYVYALVIVLVSAYLLAAHSRRVQVRTVLLHAVFVTVALVAIADSLGWAKPVWLEWREEARDLRPVAVQYRPGDAIYVWTGDLVPRVYRLPWSAELARALQTRPDRSSARLRRDARDGSWVLYPEFPEEPPPKNPPSDEEPPR